MPEFDAQHVLGLRLAIKVVSTQMQSQCKAIKKKYARMNLPIRKL